MNPRQPSLVEEQWGESKLEAKLRGHTDRLWFPLHICQTCLLDSFLVLSVNMLFRSFVRRELFVGKHVSTFLLQKHVFELFVRFVVEKCFREV